MKDELEKRANPEAVAKLRQSVAAIVIPQNMQPMETAPKDGTEIEILFRHTNWKYANEADKENWQEWCRTRWTNHNGGGWVWHGICGNPVGWRPKSKTFSIIAGKKNGLFRIPLGMIAARNVKEAKEFAKKEYPEITHIIIEEIKE